MLKHNLFCVIFSEGAPGLPCTTDVSTGQVLYTCSPPQPVLLQQPGRCTNQSALQLGCSALLQTVLSSTLVLLAQHTWQA